MSGLDICAPDVTLIFTMVDCKIIHKHAVAATIAVTVAFSTFGVAAQEADLRDSEALLDRLATATPEEAAKWERQLQALWSQSGSASMDLLLTRGRDALEAGDTEAAIEHLTALTDHAPDFAEGWYARATVYFIADLYGPALADLERALALNPQNYEALIGLAVMLEQFGAPDLALDALHMVEEIHPNHERLSELLALLEAQVGGEEL